MYYITFILIHIIDIILYGQSAFLLSVRAALGCNGTSIIRNSFHVMKVSRSVYFTASVDVAYSSPSTT